MVTVMQGLRVVQRKMMYPERAGVGNRFDALKKDSGRNIQAKETTPEVDQQEVSFYVRQKNTYDRGYKSTEDNEEGDQTEQTAEEKPVEESAKKTTDKGKKRQPPEAELKQFEEGLAEIREAMNGGGDSAGTGKQILWVFWLTSCCSRRQPSHK